MLPPFVFVNYNAKINPIKYSVKNGYFLTVHFIGSILNCERGDYLFLLRYVKSAIKNTPNESINEIASKLSVKLSMPRA